MGPAAGVADDGGPPVCVRCFGSRRIHAIRKFQPAQFGSGLVAAKPRCALSRPHKEDAR